MIFRIDDLPGPEGPDSTTHSPASTWKDTPRTTGSSTPPCRCMVKVFSALLMSIIAVIANSWRQDRGNEQLGVGLARVVEPLIGETCLDHLPALHYHHAIREQPRHRE